MTNTPLKGIRVVDFTVAGAGPAAGKMLADWGADVIKIEPLDGENGRFTGLTLGMRADEEQNPHEELKDGNKRGIPLNLKDPRGMEVMDKLLATANIFISNYRLKALTKAGPGLRGHVRPPSPHHLGHPDRLRHRGSRSQ